MSRSLPGLSALALLLLLAAITGSEAGAHPLAPALLEVRELAGGRAEVAWKTSRVRLPGARVQTFLPQECRALTAPLASGEAATVTLRWTVDCGSRGLVGRRLGVEGLEGARIEALVRVTLSDGRVVSGVVAHIKGGLDHLLFVFGLLLLVSGVRLLVQTITAFTAGHSITLSLAALGIASVPSRPVEVLIAVSVFVLALELARPAQRPSSLMRHRPWGMAMVFGLLHGLGFAAALREIGLPEQEIPLALFSFNAGIELGQLSFVAGVLGARWLLAAYLDRLPSWVGRLPVYALGSLSVFWCLERIAALFA